MTWQRRSAHIVGVVCWAGTADQVRADVRIRGFELVHNVPVETALATPDIGDPVAVWCGLIDNARETMDFQQFYVASKSGKPLDRVLASLEAAGGHGVRIRFLMEEKGVSASDRKTLERLKHIPNLTFRLLEFGMISPRGIIHAKFIVVDGRATFVGSQNFDWRSLEHIDETGLRIDDRRMVCQIHATFAQDWAAQDLLARGRAVPALHRQDDVLSEGLPTYLLASPNRFDPDAVGDSEVASPLDRSGQARRPYRGDGICTALT